MEKVPPQPVGILMIATCAYPILNAMHLKLTRKTSLKLINSTRSTIIIIGEKLLLVKNVLKSCYMRFCLSLTIQLIALYGLKKSIINIK